MSLPLLDSAMDLQRHTQKLLVNQQLCPRENGENLSIVKADFHSVHFVARATICDRVVVWACVLCVIWYLDQSPRSHKKVEAHPNFAIDRQRCNRPSRES